MIETVETLRLTLLWGHFLSLVIDIDFDSATTSWKNHLERLLSFDQISSNWPYNCHSMGWFLMNPIFVNEAERADHCTKGDLCDLLPSMVFRWEMVGTMGYACMCPNMATDTLFMLLWKLHETTTSPMMLGNR
jgi:hypothetical protein